VELRIAGQEEQDIHRPRDQTRDHILHTSDVLDGSHVEHEIAILHPMQLLHAFEESLDRRQCEPCLGGHVVPIHNADDLGTSPDLARLRKRRRGEEGQRDGG